MIYKAIDKWNGPNLEHYGVKGMKWKSHKTFFANSKVRGLKRTGTEITNDLYGPDGSHYHSHDVEVVNPRVSKRETKHSARYAINQAYKPKATIKNRVQSRLLNAKSRLKTRGRKIMNKLFRKRK